MISAVKPTKFMANSSICSIIIGKLHHEKKPYSIIFVKVNKNLEISFYCIILPLSLVIYLKIKSSKKFLFDA